MRNNVIFTQLKKEIGENRVKTTVAEDRASTPGV
jgi:hypothetical protein